MNHSNQTPTTIGRRRAITDCMGITGFLVYLSSIGFGAMAYTAGLTLQDSFLNEVLIHGLPGQINHINISAIGGGFLMTFLAVAFANFRMFPMVISTMGYIQKDKIIKKSIWIWILLMQGCISTVWIRTLSLCDDLCTDGRYAFYKFSAIIYIITIPLFVIIGFLLVQNIAHPWNLILSIIVPLFLFTQGISPKHYDCATASILGLISIVGLYPIFSMWAVIIGAIGSSVMAYWLWHTEIGQSFNPFYKSKTEHA